MNEKEPGVEKYPPEEACGGSMFITPPDELCKSTGIKINLNAVTSIRKEKGAKICFRDVSGMEYFWTFYTEEGRNNFFETLR